MAAWTKTDYDVAYNSSAERYLDGHPNTRPEVRINYHEYSIRPIMVARWQGILPVITPAITSADRVLIVGAGFGWGVKALRTQIGCMAIGTDTSPYIQGAKDSDDSVEISEKITAVGLDPLTGRGLEILNAVGTTGARAKELVLDEDMATLASRQRIGTALGGAPTWICVEDIVDDTMTDLELTDLAGFLDQSTAKKFWLYTPTNARSPQALATLTGHRVITTDFQLVTP